MMQMSDDHWPGRPPLAFRFVPPGSVVEPAPAELCLDVGNRLGAGAIDHHQPGAPQRCTAALVLECPELVRDRADAMLPGAALTLVLHDDPDLDATAAAVLVQRLLAGRVTAGARSFADYVCLVDRGETRLDPGRAFTPYALFRARQMTAGINAAPGTEGEAASRARLNAGAALVRHMIDRLDAGVALDRLGASLAEEAALRDEVALIEADLVRYRKDLIRAERLTADLPTPAGGRLRVPGLWVAEPRARLFKAWARGDRHGADDARGFVLLGVALSTTRSIVSVQPDQGVWLRGLGAMLEQAEADRRRALDQPRPGAVRPGYASSDPWYDGRSPLHGYTIVDAPHGGSVLSPAEIRRVFGRWLSLPDPAGATAS